MFKLNNFNLMFAPDDNVGGKSTVLSGDMNHEDVIDFLGEDDEKEVIDITPKKSKPEDSEDTKTPIKPSKETKETDDENEGEDEDEDELDEIEKELEPPTDEQLELVTPVRRKEILKKYPSLFKDFPYLEKAYYREQQFTELLPTIDDAKQAVEAKQVLDRFETDLMGGNTETVLKAVKETNPNGFFKIVDDYLPTLARVDEPAYFHVLGNITKHTIVAMVNEARKLGTNEGGAGVQLQNAALLLNQFVFGSSDFKPPSNLANQGRPETNEREQQLTQREQNLIKGQFERVREDLNTRVNNTLKNTIDAHLDPNNSMTEYVKKNAARDALDSLEVAINQDSRFKSLIDKLWEKAYQEGFTKASEDRIRSAYVSKAKTLLPSVIKKARNEALRGAGSRRIRNDDTDEESTPKKGPVSIGRPRSQSTSGKISKASDIPKGMSTIDFLNSE